ncbi:MAG TPA: efflux RND transporter periplasmic adaptor subunit, partial [Myxococcota bacterium]|nr:efflux RND transporter periplasmic adaptor subunit [Myxococcota bacterium]
MKFRHLCLGLLVAANLFAQIPEMTYVVETITAKEEPFAFKRRYIGTISSEYFSLLKPEMNGTIDEINVRPEQSVKKNQHLFSLDNAAQKALVKIDEKHLELAQKSLNRYKALRATGDVSKAQLDEALLAVLRAEQKLAENKKNLKNTEIRAPFDGIVGVPRVVLG